MATIQQRVIAGLWAWIEHMAHSDADGWPEEWTNDPDFNVMDMYCCKPQDWMDEEHREEFENALLAVEAHFREPQDG